MRRHLRTLGELAAVTAVTAGVLWACSSEPTTPPPDAGAFTYDAGPDGDGSAPVADAARDGLGYPIVQACNPDASENTVCRTCRARKCCESYATVFATDAGDTIADCTIACVNAHDDAGTPREPCYAKCFADTPSMKRPFVDHMACLLQNCAVECGDGSNACTDCVGLHCAAERAACGTNPDCFLAQTCLGDCNGNASCAQGCVTKYSSVKTLLDTEGTCSISHCKSECKL